MTILNAQHTIVLKPVENSPVISRHIYGHFAEHLGRCIYDGLYVGEGNTKISHTNGVRNDVIKALKNLHIPNLRWPGGCFADTYHWKDGIGPKQNRPAIVNTWWGNVTDNNSFGTHDFLNLCEVLGAEPYLSGNVGSGTVQELSEWVQYTNFEGTSPMSDLRVKNGRDKAWKVSYWGIGNEAWGCGGNMTAAYYANIYRQFSTFMPGASNAQKLFRIASGASSNDYHWTEVLMRDIPHSLLEGIALHHYAVIDWNKKGPATGFSEEIYFKSMKVALLMDELITKHTEIMDKYDPQNKVALMVDEWGGWYDVEPGTNPGFLYQQNTMRDAVLAGSTLNIFHKHAKRVKMANLAQVVNVLQAVILTDEEKLVLTPTYHVLDMYKVHQDASLIPLEIKSGEYTFDNEKLPAISASASQKNGNMNISLVNIHAKQTIELVIELGNQKVSTVSGQILKGDKVDAHNTFDNPENIKPVKFEGAKVSGNTIKVKLPPVSVVVLSLK